MVLRQSKAKSFKFKRFSRWVFLSLLFLGSSLVQAQLSPSLSDESLNGEVDITIAGAGPVGLIMAIESIRRAGNGPKPVVVILEKYEKYTRTNPLRLQKNSFDHRYIGATHHADLDERYNKWIEEMPAETSTGVLQEQLENFAREFGVKIYKGKNYELGSFHDLKSKVPHSKIYIDASGAHSVIRESLFSKRNPSPLASAQSNQRPLFNPFSIINKIDESITYHGFTDDEKSPSLKRKELDYMVEFTYPIKKMDHPHLNNIDQYWSLKKSPFYAEEIFSQKNPNFTKVNLRFFADKETYDKLDGASFKSPLHCKVNKNCEIINTADAGKMTPAIRMALGSWLQDRKHHKKEEIIHLNDQGEAVANEGKDAETEEMDIKINRVLLSSYFVKEVALQEANSLIFFIGDSSAGVPYFRALNMGVINSMNLSKNIHSLLQDLKKSRGQKDLLKSPQVMDYKNSFKSTLQNELKRANEKNGMLHVGQNLLNGLGSLPWNKSSYDGQLKDQCPEDTHFLH